MFRVLDTAKALTLKVGDKVVVRGWLSDLGRYTTRYIAVCETRFALFKDCEILEVVPPGKRAAAVPRAGRRARCPDSGEPATRIAAGG